MLCLSSLTKKIISNKIIFGALFFSQTINTFTPPTVEQVQQSLQHRQEVDLLLFAPDHAKTYKELLLWLMERSDKKIEAALYRLTDREIAKGLIAARQRGVEIEVVLDPGAATASHYSLGMELFKANISTFIYKPVGLFGRTDSRGWPTIMHHKTFIFHNRDGSSVVAFGSLNPTTAGFHGNQEAMQIRNKPFITHGFRDQFILLKERSQRLKSGDVIKEFSFLEQTIPQASKAIRTWLGLS